VSIRRRNYSVPNLSENYLKKLNYFEAIKCGFIPNPPNYAKATILSG
jgi:hypothetical protein